MDFLKRIEYRLVVFLTGMAVLVVEVGAVRILAPQFGNTLYTVSSILSVILAALAFGYYLGGRLADSSPDAKFFYTIIFAGGVSVLSIYFFSNDILRFFGGVTSRYGPLFSSMGLFFLPAFLLGTLSPFVVKLESMSRSEEEIGSVAGSVYFFSTLGSILGSLLSGFYLIPSWGISKTFISTGLLLVLISLIGGARYFRKSQKNATPIVIALFLTSSFWAFNVTDAKPPEMIYQSEGTYERLSVFDGYYDGRPGRFLKQNSNWSSGMFLDGEDLVFKYSKYLPLADYFVPEVKKSLVIGAGAYSVPKYLLARYEEADVEVVDIEPKLYEIAKEYFSLTPSKRLKNIVQDGREYLRLSEGGYDLIFGDVYIAPISLPAHFTTKEFFELAKEKMSPGGVFVINFVGAQSSKSPSILLSEIKTIREVFPNLYVFAVEAPDYAFAQNYIFVAVNVDKEMDIDTLEVERIFKEEIGFNPKNHLLDLSRFDFDKELVLTDDLSPIDRLMDEVIHKLGME